MEDLLIIGAGFAGLACAQAAAHRGLRVTVLERKPNAGARPHTTGLLVKEAAEAWDVPTRFTRRIRGVRLYGPALRAIDLVSPGYYFLATDTGAVLDWLAHRAERAGARVRCGVPYRGAQATRETIELIGSPLTARYLVGADGPRSRVARDFGLDVNRTWLRGVELHYEGVRGVDPDRLHVFLDSTLAPGYIAWAVPGVDGLTQIGLACHAAARVDLVAFQHKIAPLFDLSNARLVERRGGWIPVGGPLARIGTPRVLLTGDAAGLVSPLTAGGIHLALDAGRRAGHAIADHLLDRGVDPAVAMRPAPYLVKRALRRAFDLAPPNALYDALVGNPILAAAARWTFFHKRGPFSARAWREIFEARSGLRDPL